MTILLGSLVASVLGLFVPQKFHWFWWNDIILVFLRKMMKWICGLEIEVRGEKNIQKGAAIYASKHQSAVETYFMTSILKKATFIFKIELTHIPFFGWAIRFYGSVPVNRSGGSKAITRTKPGEAGEYKPGAAFLYQNTDVPVVPVALNSALFWAKKSFLRKPGKIIIEFLPPVPRGLDKREFMSFLKSRIEEKCTELNEETIKNYPETKQLLHKK